MKLKKGACHLKFIPAREHLMPDKMLAKSQAPSMSLFSQTFLAKQEKTDAVKQLSPTEKYHNFVSVIYTNDVYFTSDRLEEKLSKTPKHTVSINTSMKFSDVWEKSSCKGLDHKTKSIDYHVEVGDITQWLLKGETVILKGQLSKSLAGKMETLFAKEPHLWINGKCELIKGRLIIVTENKDSFLGVENAETFTITQQDYWSHLQKDFKPADCEYLKRLIDKIPEQKLKKANYRELATILNEQKYQPYRNPLRSKALLSSEPVKQLKSITSLYKVTPLKSEEKDLLKRRIHKMVGMLAHSPYVFLIGPSGTGKSTTILDQLKNYYNHEKKLELKLFVGMEKIEAWASQLDEKYPTVLFIDEANLQKDKSFEIFEGLYNNPPSILINGKYYPIKDHQKIIFAGNYSNYKDRIKHDFFERHGSVMLFKEWPRHYLLEKFVLPVLQLVQPDDFIDDVIDIQLVGKYIVDYYIQLKQHKPNCLLTPRNLHAMCLRAGYLARLFTDLKPFEIAKLAAFNEGMHLSEQEIKTQAIELHIIDKLSELEMKSISEFKSTDYQLLPSRYSIIKLFKEELGIRELKYQEKKLDAYGTRGILIEGPSGVGKSSFVKQYLKSEGYIQSKIDTLETNEIKVAKENHKVFYHITPTRVDKMLTLLHKAFHEGAIVIIDEINSSPLEVALNTYLMSKDLSGQPALRPGFFVIGTQNPPTFHKRKILSLAYENRFHKITLNEYPDNELVLLAKSKQCSHELAINLVEDFKKIKKRAIVPRTTRYFIEDMVKPVVQQSHRADAKVISPIKN